MSDFNPLQHPQWHRVAALKPLLPPEVDVARVWLRGQLWHVLNHRVHGQRCRLNPQAYQIAARMDGQHTVDQLWRQLEEAQPLSRGTEPPSQDDTIEVLRLLMRHQLLSFEQAPDLGTLQVGALTGDQPSAAPDPLSAAAPNTLWHWRIPLGDPSAWLNRHTWLADLAFSPMGLAVWVCLVASMLAGWLLHGAALLAHASVWMATPNHLLLSVLLYPIIKGLHEAAHALAIRRWGGQVQSCGIALMMLMPVPYVDASAAHGFGRAWQRALVSAAGIMAELALASMGLWLWVVTEPGWLHHISFVTWFIGCLSTLLFNGNPLQRLDGYHVLTDALQLPGLAVRSRQWWSQAVQRWLLNQTTADHRVDMAPEARGERVWLMAYAPAAWTYQVFLWTAMSLWLGSVSEPLGWVLASFSAWMLAIKPMQNWIQMLAPIALGSAAQGQTPPWKRAAWLVVVPLLAVLVPMPDRTMVQGVVWAPETALVRPAIDGLVEAVVKPDGSQVRPGDLLIRLHNPKLMARRQQLQAQLDRAEQAQFTHLGMDGSKAGQAGDEVTQLQSQMHRLTQQIESLEVRAQHAGRLSWPQPHDLPGRYLPRGTLIGHILDGQSQTVRMAVGQDQASRLRDKTRTVSVRLSDPRGDAQAGQLIRDSIGATRELPSAALSDAMGGDTATDPTDEQHRRTLRPVVLMDVKLADRRRTEEPVPVPSDPNSQTRLGERAWVRLDHGWAPLIWQWARSAQARINQTFTPRS